MLVLRLKRNISPKKEQIITVLSRATIYAILIIAFSIILLCMAGWWFSYEEIMTWFHQKTRLYFETSTEGKEFLFTYEKYQISHYVSLVLLGIIVGAIILIYRCWHTCIVWLDAFYQSLDFFARKYIRTVRGLARWKILTFALILLLAVTYQIFHYNQLIIYIDDLCSYYYFAQNIIITSIFYPIPNNHIFYNQLSYILSCFIEDPLLSTRLPSLISFVLLGILLFGFQLQFFKDQKIAFLGLVLIMFLLPSSIYASQGRGYMLQNLCIVFSAIMMILGVLHKQCEYFIGFIIGSIVGAYTIPTFLIPFLANVIFGITVCILQKDKKGFQIIVGSCLLTGIGVVFCYMPVFLFSGISSVIDNSFVTPINPADFFTKIYPIVIAEYLSFFAGTTTRGWVIFLICIVLVIPIFRQSSDNVRYWMLLTFIHIAAIFLYILLRKSFIPFRSTTYVCFFLYISFSVVVVFWLNRILSNQFVHRFSFAILFVSILIISYWQYQHNVFIPYIYPSYYTRQLSSYADEILNKNISVYIDKRETYFTFYFKYRTVKDGRSSFTTSDPENADLLFLKVPFTHQDFLEKFHLKEKLTDEWDHVYIFERNDLSSAL